MIPYQAKSMGWFLDRLSAFLTIENTEGTEVRLDNAGNPNKQPYPAKAVGVRRPYRGDLTPTYLRLPSGAPLCRRTPRESPEMRQGGAGKAG